MDLFDNKKVKKAEIWADIKFIPSNPKRDSVVETTRKQKPTLSRRKQIIFHIKEIWRILKNGKKNS